MINAVRKTGLIISVFGASLFSIVGVSTGQQYPDKPINIIVALPQEGSVSISLRIMTDKIEKVLGQPFVLTNNANGGGAVAAGIVTKQSPDGYHLLGSSSSPLVRIPLFRPVPYNLDDFIPVLSFGEMQSALYVRADSPWKTLKELVDYARQNPGKVTYSLTGTGQPQHMVMEYIAKQEGIRWNAVPASGGDPNIMLLGGHVTASSSGTAYLSHVKAGKLRILATHSPKRLSLLPDVPTMRECGYDIINETVMMVAAPKGTPPEIVKKLDGTFHKAMEDPEFIKYMESVAQEIVYRDSETTKKYLQDAYFRLGKLIKDLNIPTEHK